MLRLVSVPAIALLTGTASAQFGFYDGFNSPGATPGNDANDPTDLGFHAMHDAPALQVRQVEGRGGVLAASLSAPGSSRSLYASESLVEPVFLSHLTEVTLGFSMRATVPGGAGGIPTFAFGLHNSMFTRVVDDSIGSYINTLDDQGYHLYLSGSDTIQSSVQTDFSGPRLDIESGRAINPFNFADGDWHDFRLVLRDEGDATFITFDVYIDGQLHVTDTLLPRGVFRFDTVHFGLIDGTMDMELDDLFVSIAVVPPPGTLTLLALGVAAAGRRRR